MGFILIIFANKYIVVIQDIARKVYCYLLIFCSAEILYKIHDTIHNILCIPEYLLSFYQ